MQKVTYVLLRQHAEKYWESRHDEDDDAYQGNWKRWFASSAPWCWFGKLTNLLFIHLKDTQGRRYSTMSGLGRRRISMHAEFTSSSDALSPPGFAPETRRRSSPSTYRRSSLTPADARQYPLIHPTELPPSPMPSPRIRSKSGTSRADLSHSQSRVDSDVQGSRRNSTKEG